MTAASLDGAGPGAVPVARSEAGKVPAGPGSPPTEGAALVAALEARLAVALGNPVTVDALTRMSGGASRETWAFDATTSDGTVLPLVLRRGAGVGALSSAGRPGVVPDVPVVAGGASGVPGRGSVPPGESSVPGPAVGTASMMLEAAASTAAGTAGVPVARILLAVDDDPDLGGSALVAERIDGETLARRIYRALDAAGPDGRSALAGQCAAAAARLHTVAPEEVEGLAVAVDPLGTQRAVIDELGVVSPAFELGLRWLGAHRPPSGPSTLVHGDFRVGNMIVGPSGLAAVLDWELVHAGDPLEDLGWFCSRAWRFGEDHNEAGGLCSVEELAAAYEAGSGRSVDRAALAWWIVMADLHWGVICAKQAERHLSGAEESVELATIGRRLPEAEWDVLAGLRRARRSTDPGPKGGPEPVGTAGGQVEESPSGARGRGRAVGGPSGADGQGEAGERASGVGDVPGRVGGVPGRVGGKTERSGGGREHMPSVVPEVHGRPSAAVLIGAVRTLLDGPVRASLTGPVAFQARVAANALRMVEREMLLGPGQRDEASEVLADLGYTSEVALAADIRSGVLDDRLDEVSGPVRRIVAMRLDVVHPGYDTPRLHL